LQVLLLSGLGVVGLAGVLLFRCPLFELSVDLVAVELVLLFLGQFLFQELLSGHLAEGHVLHVISLFEDLTTEVLLFHFVGVLSTYSIAEAALSGLILPVSLRRESTFLNFAVDLDRSLLHVATSEDRRLEVLELAVLAVQIA